jgi:hypothetical protein
MATLDAISPARRAFALVATCVGLAAGAGLFAKACTQVSEARQANPNAPLSTGHKTALVGSVVVTIGTGLALAFQCAGVMATRRRHDNVDDDNEEDTMIMFDAPPHLGQPAPAESGWRKRLIKFIHEARVGRVVTGPGEI